MATSSTWISRWQPTGPAPRRCTRRKASPFSGMRVANSPEVPLAADKVDLVTSCQKEHADANVPGGKSINPVTQPTATATGYALTLARWPAWPPRPEPRPRRAPGRVPARRCAAQGGLGGAWCSWTAAAGRLLQRRERPGRARGREGLLLPATRPGSPRAPPASVPTAGVPQASASTSARPQGSGSVEGYTRQSRSAIRSPASGPGREPSQCTPS